MRTASLAVLFFTLTGCARYEFDVLQPQELAAHIGSKQATQATIARDPLTYVMRAVEGRLVMHVENRGGTPIELLGGRSYVVDPGEQSHPLPSMSIAPDSYIKLVLPPMPVVYRTGPSWGFGIGVGVSSAHRHHHSGTSVGTGIGYGTGGPVYAADGPGNVYWDWDGETDVRLRLTYQRQDETFIHEWVFHRRKM